MTTHGGVRILAALGLSLLAWAARGAPQLSVSPLGYRVTALQRVSGLQRTYDVTARAGVVNLGDPATDVTARLSSSSPGLIPLDGDVSFGDVPRTSPLRPVTSRDTFKLRIVLPPRRELLEFVASLHRSLAWTIGCGNCGVANRPPLASAGPDQTVFAWQVVVLDGSASSDPDGQPLGFAWSFVTLPAGSTAALDDPGSVHPTFTPDREGDYVVQLVVNDGTADSAPDAVRISTLNSAPVADAGPDQAARVGDAVPLDGSGSSDADGDPLTYAWSVLARPAGSIAQLVAPLEAHASLTPDVAGQYVVELTVDDGTVSSAPDTMTISTSGLNTPPVAAAGPDQPARVGDTVQLDGSGSSDADGDPLTYSWSLTTGPAGSAAELSGPSTATPALSIDLPGTYVAQLVVNDGTADSAPDTVSISTVNARPIALAGPDQTVRWNTTVQLDGSASSDPDGDALGFAWSILSRPAGSGAALSGAGTAGPTFLADRPGLYVVQLVVNDGLADGVPATVSVTATNLAPVAAGDAATTLRDAPIDVGVLANDADPDGDPLAIAAVTQPAHGTASIAGAAVRYVPAAGFTGQDAFDYTATDGADSASATVSVTVTAPAPALPELSIDDVSVSEGDAGTTTVDFTVTLSAPSPDPITVDFATADGTAVAPGDYLAIAGTVRIEAGATSADVQVTVNGDTVAEPDEALLVRLSGAVGATIADGEGLAEVVDDDPGAPTTFDLVERALADGLIDAETALVYEVFAEFRDPRLPAQYLGRDDPSFEGAATMEAARRFADLSPATQAILAPFLEFPDLFALPVTGASQAQPPAAARALSNALAADASYTVLELVPGMVRMGWNENSPVAFALEQAANALQAEFTARIWPKLTTALGTPTAGKKILILVGEPPGESGEKVSTDCTTARIWLYEHHRWVLAHELTHALIDLNFSNAACNVDEKLWMHEATATWAQHHVYPPSDQGKEQRAATYFLRQPDRSLSAFDPRNRRGHQYGAYLWFLRLAGQENNPGVVRAIWQSAAGVTSLEAIESVLRGSGLGGFEDQWPKFALDNWNREAPYRKYQQWDRLIHRATQSEYTADLQGQDWQVLSLGYDLPFLSADYQQWDFTGDPRIRGILVLDSAAGQDPNARIWAIVKLRNQPWPAAEDWSDAEEKSFCRDNPAEDVEKVVLVVSHRGFQPSAPRIKDEGNLSLYYSAMPCADWLGNTTYRHEERPIPGAVSVTTAEGTGLQFHVDLTQNRAVWRAIAGTVTARWNDTSPFEDGTCTSTATRSFPAKDHAQLELLPQGSELVLTGAHVAFLPTPPTVSVTTECTSSSGSFTITQDVPWFGTSWFYTGPTPWPFDAGATSLTGAYPATPADERWTWDLVKAQ